MKFLFSNKGGFYGICMKNQSNKLGFSRVSINTKFNKSGFQEKIEILSNSQFNKPLLDYHTKMYCQMLIVVIICKSILYFILLYSISLFIISRHLNIE